MFRLSTFLLFAFAGLLRAELTAGAFAIDVTPKKYPVSVNGGFADITASAANDPLHARCLVIDDGKTRLAMVVVDSCAIPRELMEDAKKQAQEKTGIPADHILISATHTHSAPTVTSAFQSDPNTDYVVYLAQRIAEGIQKANDLRKPAQIGFGRGRDESQVFNRRWKREQALIPADPFGNTTDRVQMNPGHQVKGLVINAGPVDPEICFLSVQHADGKPMALFATYSLHYVGGNPALSADYFGAYSERLKQMVGAGNPDFVAAMHNGTSGDVNNIDFSKEAIKAGPGERIRVVAESVARNTVSALAKVEYSRSVTLAAAVQDLKLGVRKPSEAELVRAKKILQDNEGKKSLVGSAAVYARETVLIQRYPDRVPLKLQVLRVGDTAIYAIPCEVFVEIGLELKKKSPWKNSYTISLANGYNGYLPTPQQHELGGYETWRARSSYLETGASPRIVDCLMELTTRVR